MPLIFGINEGFAFIVVRNYGFTRTSAIDPLQDKISSATYSHPRAGGFGGVRGVRALLSGRFCGHGGRGKETSSAEYSHLRPGGDSAARAGRALYH